MKCDLCDFDAKTKYNYNRHLLTKKHINNEKLKNNIENETKNKIENESKNKKNFSCDLCNYYTNSKQSIERHLDSIRHNKVKKGEIKGYVCDICNKVYNSYNGILKHKNVCIETRVTIKNKQNSTQVEDIMELLKTLTSDKQNVIVNIGNITNNTQQINNNQQINNIQNILNEKCAETPTFIDYVKKFKVKNEDMHEIHYKSFIEGMYAILIKNMNKLPREKWPIFCVEEQTFIRERDEWMEHDIEKIKEFVYSFYDIVYKIYLHNNKANDEYQKRFMYREIKEKMKNFVKDDEMCSCMAEDILRYFTMKKDEFYTLFDGSGP